MSTTVTMTKGNKTANQPLSPLDKAKRLMKIITINKDANKNLAQVIRQMRAQRNARPRASRNFRDKFFDIRKRRGVPVIDINALAACPPGDRHKAPVILLQGPSPTVDSQPPKAMERRLATYKDMTAITKYDSEEDAQIKYFIQLRDYYERYAFVHYTHYAAPVPAVDIVPQTVQDWVNYAPAPAPAKRRLSDESDGYSRKPAKRVRHSFSTSAAPCNQ